MHRVHQIRRRGLTTEKWNRPWAGIALIALGSVIERFGLFIRMIGPPQAHTGCSGSPTEAFAAVFMRIAPLAAIALGLATRLVASG
ncbi:hypothetical protein [Oryzomicrobium sp.]|uniref:hypothetical protein n=1 Tax=Oryzomicrobium sp. TaxID=1911578 RepID=UPI002FE0CA39